MMKCNAARGLGWTCLILFLAVIGSASQVLAYGGGGGGGDVGGGSGLADCIGDPMPVAELSTFVDGSSMESVGPSELSHETHEEGSEARDQADIDIAFWSALYWGSRVLHEEVGWYVRFTLNFVPGVGWYTNAGLSALDTAVDSHVEGHTPQEVFTDAAISGTISGLTSNFGPGRNAANALNNAAGVKGTVKFVGLTLSNVATEEGTNGLVNGLREQGNRAAMVSFESVDVTPGYDPMGGGGLGPEADLTGGVR